MKITREQARTYAENILRYNETPEDAAIEAVPEWFALDEDAQARVLSKLQKKAKKWGFFDEEGEVGDNEGDNEGESDDPESDDPLARLETHADFARDLAERLAEHFDDPDADEGEDPDEDDDLVGEDDAGLDDEDDADDDPDDDDDLDPAIPPGDEYVGPLDSAWLEAVWGLPA